MMRIKILPLALLPLLVAATCDPDRGDPIQNVDTSNDPTIITRCGDLKIGNVTVTAQQIEGRIQAVIDALGLDFSGKTLIIEARAFQNSSAIAFAALNTANVDDADRARLVINTNELGTFLSNPNVTNLVLAHELNHLTKLFDANDGLRQASANLATQQKAFQPFSNRPNDDLEKQRAYVAIYEATIPYTEAVIIEEQRAYGNVNNDRAKLEQAGLLSGDGKAEAGTIAANGSLQNAALKAKLANQKIGLTIEKKKLERLEAEQQNSEQEETPPSEDEQAALDRHRLKVDPTALQGDGDCGLLASQFSVFHGVMTLRSSATDAELLIPLEITEIGLTDNAAIFGDLDVTCSAFMTISSIEDEGFECFGSSSTECGESIGPSTDPSEFGPFCDRFSNAIVDALKLTCFTDSDFTDVLCEETLSAAQ